MGKIIVIEGVDGSGKETQSKMLTDRLLENGYKVKMQSFPNYNSPSSEPVKMYLGGQFGGADSMDAYQSSVLFSVDRLCTMMQYKNYLASGGNMVLDRYTPSNIIHQCTKIAEGEWDEFTCWLEELEYGKMKLPRPDIVVYLSMPVSTSISLMQARADHKTNLKKDVHEEDNNHLYKAHRVGEAMCDKLNWIKIDCVDENNEILSRAEIHEKIYKAVMEKM